MLPNVHGMFPFSQAGPSDILTSPTWATGEEGTQNYQEYHDSSAAHHGDTEDYGHFPYHGHVTPRGLGQDHSGSREDLSNQWLAAHSAVAPIGGEAMKRGTSRSSAGSHKHRSVKASSVKSRSRLASISQESSKLSKKDMAGNAFHDGPQAAGQMDMKPLFQEPEPASHYYYGNLQMDLAMPADGMQYPPGLSLHVAPSQMQYDPDTALTGSPVSSWDAFSAVDSSMASPPQMAEDVWSVPATSPDSHDSSSPVLNGQVRYVPRDFCPAALSSHAIHRNSMTRSLGTQHMMPEDLTGSALTAIGGGEDYSTAFSSRRASEGESARDHYLYKSATPSADGLYHCPWEGDQSCNHKPEKLKCNYE